MIEEVVGRVNELQPIRDQIFFNFAENVTLGKFHSKSSGGILLAEHAHSQVKTARWAVVKCIGPDVKEDIAIGDIILIENLRWTSEFIVNDESYWITMGSEILATWSDKDNLPQEIS